MSSYLDAPDAPETSASTPSRARLKRPMLVAGAAMLIGLVLIASYAVRQRWDLMPDYARGWHLGTTLTDQPLSRQCVVTAEQRYPGQVIATDGTGITRPSWAFLAGCSDAQHRYLDMRWQLMDRLHGGSRGGSDD